MHGLVTVPRRVFIMIDELIPEFDGSLTGRPDLIVVFPEGVITPPREEIIADLFYRMNLTDPSDSEASPIPDSVLRLLLSSSFLSMSDEYFIHALSEQTGQNTDVITDALEAVLSPDFVRDGVDQQPANRVRYTETIELLTRIGELFPLFLWNDLPDFILNPLVTDRNTLFSRCIRRKFAPGQPSLTNAVEELIGGNEASNPLFIAWNPQVLYPLVSRGLDAIVHADASRLRRELVLRGVSLQDIPS